MKKTAKPCPGCGTPGRRDADKVCSGCQALLAEAIQARAAKDADTARGNFLLAYQYYSLPYFHNQVSETAARQFQEAFHRLCRLTSEPITHVWKSKCDPVVEGIRETHQTVSMAVEMRDCLNTLYQATLLINDNAYRQGEKSGNAFVFKLAKGEVSIDDYNNATLK